MKKSLHIILYCTLIIAILSTSTLATEYYIDQEIEIMENGDAVVDGITNVDLFSDLGLDGDIIQGTTSELTSKSGKYWLVEYNNDQTISNYIIKIKFPKHVKINHIGSKSKLLVEDYEGHTILTFIGTDQILDIKVQYSFSGVDSNESFFMSYWFYLALIVVGLIIYLVGASGETKDKTKKEHKQKTLNKTKLDTIKLTLNETQLKIVDALLDQDGECSQTKLRHLTGIPKASLSRNLELLSQKHVVSKYYNGTSNYIKVNVGLYGE